MSMVSHDLVSLPADDQDYTDWVTQHKQHGYVINAHKAHSVPMVWPMLWEQEE